MKLLLFLLCLQMITLTLAAQELYIQTEPASNMPAKSIGLRLNGKLMPMLHDNQYNYRIESEIMIGFNKNLMVHGTLYSSTMFTNRYHLEGGSIYGKYRFLSKDDIHSHFRMAAFGKLSYSSNPAAIEYRTRQVRPDGSGYEETNRIYSDEIDLAGNSSGLAGGLIATQLIHKLAVSGSAYYQSRWGHGEKQSLSTQNNQAVNYSLSGGYLLFPRKYQSYREMNLNLYLEFLGGYGLEKKGYFVDMAPGIQFIFNSIARLDLSFRTQLKGDMRRFNQNSWLVRYEYNFLNVLNRKKS